MRGVRLDDLVEQLRAEVGHSTNPAVSINGRDYLVQVLKRTQERLWEEYDWPWFKVSRDLLVEKGQRYYSVPSDLAYERITDVSFKYGSAWHCLSHGIDERQYSTYDSDRDVRSWPLVAWDVAEDTGVIDDIGVVELWPIPSRSSNNNDGQVRLTGFRKLKQFKDGNDKCELDGTLIVLMAASEIQARQNQSDAALKLQQATALLSRLQNQSSNKEKFTNFTMGGCDDDVGFRPREVTSVTSLGGGGGGGGGEADCGDYVPLGGTELSSPIEGELRFSTDGLKDWKLTQISDIFGGNAITFSATGSNSGMYVATIAVDGTQNNFSFEPDGDFTVPRTLVASGVAALDGGVGAANLVTKGKLLEVGDFGIITQSAFSADDLTGGGGDGPLPSGSVKDTLVCAGNELWVSTSLMQIDEADTKVTVNGELIADGIISNAGIGSVVFTDTGRNVEVGPFGLLQQSAFDSADIITKDAEGDVEIPRTLTASAVAALDGGLAASNLTEKGKALEVGEFGIIVPSAYNAADVVYADEDGDVTIGRTLTADGVFATSGGLGAANLAPKGRALQIGDFGIIEPASYAADKVVFEDSEGDVTIGRTLTADALAATNGGVGASNLTVKGRLLQVGDFGIIEQSSVTAGDIGGVPESRTISSGSGLNGGGNLSQNRTLTVDNTVLRTSGDQITSGALTATGFAATTGSFGSTQFNTKGRLLQVGDFGIIEQASVSASDLDGVPESRTISSGTGLSGGGNLSANRTLSVDSSVIRNTGTQSVGGSKTFTSKLHASNSMKVGTTLTEPAANSLTVGGRIASEGMPAGTGAYLVNSFGIIAYLSSDARLKKDVVDGTMGIDTIMKMRPVEFTWNDKTMMEGVKDIGFIAQEQKAISHHLVCEDLEWMTLKSENLNPILVKAIQQQQEVIESLITRIELLEAAGAA